MLKFNYFNSSLKTRFNFTQVNDKCLIRSDLYSICKSKMTSVNFLINLGYISYENAKIKITVNSIN